MYPQIRDADLMDIALKISSIQSVPHCTISKIARFDSSLNIILSFAKSSRIKILFKPTFNLSISLIFPSFFKSDLWRLLVRWDQFQRPLLKRISHCFQCPFPLQWRFSFHLALLLCFPRWQHLSKDAIHAFLANRLLLLSLLLHKPISLQRNLGGWPWCWESISDLRNHSTNAISHNVRSDDRKWLRLHELQSQILCRGKFYPMYGIMIVFPISFLVNILRNTVIIMVFHFIWIVTKSTQRCEKDSLSDFVVFLSSLIQSTHQNRLSIPWRSPVKD